MRTLYAELLTYWSTHKDCTSLLKVFQNASDLDPTVDFEAFLTQFYLGKRFPFEIGDCITEYFTAQQRAIAQRRGAINYLSDFVTTYLERGDTIVTFNYDSLMEIVLGEQGLWNITHGYGFPRRIVSQDGPLIEPESPCTVLKLHGSVGWVSTHPGFGESDFCIQDDALQFAGYAQFANTKSAAVISKYRIGDIFPSLMLNHSTRVSAQIYQTCGKQS